MAELEEYIPHVRPEPGFGSYVWMFGVLGALHRSLAAIDLTVPRPLVATYAPPGSLRRWLPVTEAAVCDDPEAVKIAHMLHALVNTLRRQSVAAAELPAQLVHGDFRLGNICRNAAGRTVYLDFGFTALRPRIHDIAYALAFMLLVLKRDQTTESIDRDSFMQLIMAYESTCGEPLRKIERQALFPYAAAVPLYAAALDGFTEDPAGKLRSRLPFLRLSEWLLIHPMR